MAKILVVDDSKLVAHVARGILAQRGHEVVLAADGEAGLRLVMSEHPDLVLLDLIMPGLDGYQVCRRLKKMTDTADIPVIMLTSKAEPDDKVRGLETGAADYVTKPFNEGELVARVNIHLHIRELHEALREKNRQLEELASRDGLTGLYNHRFFQEAMAKDFLRAFRYQEPLSCIIFDVDYFKKINDTYGHQTGDLVLASLGRLVSGEFVRDSDLAARYGGEEFALLLYHTGGQDAFAVGERLRQTVEQHPFGSRESRLQVTISVGVASFPHAEIAAAKDLIACADKALYRAKEGGRNRVIFF